MTEKPDPILKFVQPAEGIVIVKRATTRTLLTPDVIDAARARVAAGADPRAVARELAAQDLALRKK